MLRWDRVFAYQLNVLYADVMHLTNRALVSEQCLLGFICICVSVHWVFDDPLYNIQLHKYRVYAAEVLFNI